MEIPVPYTKVQSCHDDLAAHAAVLWQAFDTRLVPLARGEGEPWERLELVLDRADAEWEAYLLGGGNPRVSMSSWRCSVGDLSGALVQASVQRLAMRPVAERVEPLDTLSGLIDSRLSDAPNLLMMRLTIQAARL